MRVCRKHVFSQPSGFVHTGRSPALNTNIIGNSPIPVAVAIALNTNIIDSSPVAVAVIPVIRVSMHGGKVDLIL